MPKAYFVVVMTTVLCMGLWISGCKPNPTKVEPNPLFEASPTRGPIPLKVQFNDVSIPGNTPIRAQKWNFGDGALGMGPRPTHEYKTPGVYSVTLTLTTAEGNFSFTRENLIMVDKAGAYEDPDPDSGEVNVEGVTITVPTALKDKVAFGVRRDTAQITLDAFEPIITMSDTFTITHSLTPPDLFVYDADGHTVPTTLSVPMMDELPTPILTTDSLFLLARLSDGRTVPIPGRVDKNKFIASVLRLPERAQYVVALRPEAAAALTNTFTDLYQERLDADDNWAHYWKAVYSVATAREIAALYFGQMASEATYHKRDFTNEQLAEALGAFGGVAQGLLNLLAESEMQVPALVMEGGNEFHNVILYDMSKQYSYDIESISNVVYYDSFFGHIVLDPAQMLAITIRNLRRAALGSAYIDFRQPFSSSMGMAEALLQSTYPSYKIPPITTTGDVAAGIPRPADRTRDGKVKPMNFIQGLYDGGAAYLAQRVDEKRARGMGANEYGLLSIPLMFPFSDKIANYSLANHEFFSYLDYFEDVEEPLGLLIATLEGIKEAVEEYGEDVRIPLTFVQAFAGLYSTMNEVVVEAMEERTEPPIGDNLRDYYWMYAQDRAYINGQEALLRDSDNQLAPYSFNADLFDDKSLLQVAFNGPVGETSITSATNDVLQSIWPLSCRAVVFDLHSLTTELKLTFNPQAWSLDEDGYGPAIAVFKEGKTGVELSAPIAVYRDYSVEDANNDGRNDTIIVRRLEPEESDCFNRVIVLVSNLHLSKLNSVSIHAKADSGLTVPEEDVLNKYVYACDPLYEYSLRSTLDFSADEGATGYLINMTSGAWRGAHEVYETVWRHNLAIIEPTNVRDKVGMLFISGGSTGSEISKDEAKILASFAQASRSVVALLKTVPNQPLRFRDETRTRSEDAIIAYSYDKYMNSYADEKPDMTWPALLPMTRAAVRAMDTVQDFMAIKRPARTVEKFVVAGASKRGWTTWLTAATGDERVSAIIPMVIDVLNMPAQMEHHRRAYATISPNDARNYIFGGYSTSIRDYVELNVFDRFDTAAGQSLLHIVDPFSYRDLLKMPKLILNSTGDQFFLPDSSQFYFNQIPGDNYLHYAANTDHSLTDGLAVDDDTLETMLAYYIAHVRNNNAYPGDNVLLPSYEWTALPNRMGEVENEDGDSVPTTFARTLVTADQIPTRVVLWQAYAPEHRDFRLQTLGAVWKSTRLSFDESQVGWVGEAAIPETGWRAFCIQMFFVGPDGPAGSRFIFTTPVRVVPDEYGL